MTCVYPNQFARIGLSDDIVRQRVQSVFDTIFSDHGDGFYHETDPDASCLEDTGNHDARTEGMSYGMMMAVQMDRKDLFDKLWCFSKRYMYLSEGPMAGYFAWSVQLDGKHNAEGPAPDGEEYYAMALLMASARWGDGEGIYAYGQEARAILRHMIHQPEITGGGPMMDADHHYILFVPGSPFSDASYHLPHFYELFALKADEADRPFWKAAAAAAREYITISAHPETGMCPEYGEFDGSPRLMFHKPYAFYSDAYRVIENIALDSLWFGKNPAFLRIAQNLQHFFASIPEEQFLAYDLDGTPHDEPAMHPVAITATIASGSVLCDGPEAEMWLKRFWDTPPRKGPRRYYDNCLYFFCLLILSGMYRMYI